MPRRASLVIHRLKATPAGVEIRTGAGSPRFIPFQYNPESITRTIGGSSGEGEAGAETLRLTGPPSVSLKFTAELLAWSMPNAAAREYGVGDTLAALEGLLYPAYAETERQLTLAAAGKIEVVPAESQLVLFAWAKKRIAPVKLEALTVTEDRFDGELHPVHAKVEMTLRVLTLHDLGYDHPGSRLARRYHRELEQLATSGATTSRDGLGLSARDIGLS